MIFSYLCAVNKSTVPACRWFPQGDERKVRAAQDAPLLKVEVIGDSKCRQKKTTAFPVREMVRVRRWCKRPPAGRRRPGCAIWGLQVHVNRRLRVVRPRASLPTEGRTLEP